MSRGEIISAVDGLGNPTRLKVLARHPFHEKRYGADPKFELAVDLGETHPTWLFGRHVSHIHLFPGEADFYTGMTPSQIYREKWAALQKAGLPVPQSLYILSDTEVALEHLTHERPGHIYGKGESLMAQDVWLNGYPPPAFFGTPKTDEILKSQPTLAPIEARLYQLAGIATAGGVLLPNDDPMQVAVYENGEITPVMVDFEDARIVSRCNTVGLDIPLYNEHMALTSTSQIAGPYYHLRNAPSI